MPYALLYQQMKTHSTDYYLYTVKELLIKELDGGRVYLIKNKWLLLQDRNDI